MSKKKFTMTATETNGNLEIEFDNDGFNAFEIIGMLEHKQNDIIEQLNKPCEFKRYYIDENGNRIEKVREVVDE